MDGSSAAARSNWADDRGVLLMCDLPLIAHAGRIALDLGLFEALTGETLELPALAARLRLGLRGCDALCAAAAWLGLVERRGARGRWLALSEAGRDYLTAEGRFTQHAMLRLARAADGRPPAECALRLALERDAEGRPPPWPEAMCDPSYAAEFTAAMSAHSRAPAQAWSRQLDLRGHRHLLDLGGGAGDHARAALECNPALAATVLELPTVIAAAQALRSADAALEARLQWLAVDLFGQGWPAADLHLYADVLHDWPAEVACELLERSHASLPHGGRVLVHELLIDDRRCGPAAAVGAALAMLMWTGGQQYSAEELADMLAAAGFREIRVERTLGAWGMVCGVR